jgi:hypothetical protein
MMGELVALVLVIGVLVALWTPPPRNKDDDDEDDGPGTLQRVRVTATPRRMTTPGRGYPRR